MSTVFVLPNIWNWELQSAFLEWTGVYMQFERICPLVNEGEWLMAGVAFDYWLEKQCVRIHGNDDDDDDDDIWTYGV
jgi:hypothetical protein